MKQLAVTSLALFAAAAAWVRPAPGISGDVREFLSRIRMEDMQIDDQGHTVRVAIIDGINLQLVNGAGYTSGTNGAGNLIIGYNEPDMFLDRLGSHNIVVGYGNNWGHLANSGIVAGNYNSIERGGASVIGGAGNTATGTYAVVIGGISNRAWGVNATVTGGFGNTANGEAATVSGGSHRRADNQYDWSAGGLWEDE